MAGRIKREDVDAVRERTRIEEVVGERVALKPAGSGSMKGLCPFHDERTPSFHVRPALSVWHCFGCGEGGDAIAFLRKADSLSFAEAVEYLAGRYGVTLHYEAGGGRDHGPEVSGRGRLIQANQAAADFFAAALLSPAARAGRDFLASRGFDRETAGRYGVGFAPDSWDTLLRHLRGSGFTEAEIVAAGLATQGQRGLYDRFRGRLMWPIRDLTGSVVGFGARKLDESDQGPKYLNTPETPIYHKAQVLYGVDLAKREISRERLAVIVEGYTDVMAAHSAGVGTAIATCGTAFGDDHVRVVRRLLGDAAGSAVPGRVVFTFDGDEAGQKAALRAFEQDQSFYADTFVAVAPDGMDPCELRLAQGDDAVRRLVADATPLFKFAIQTVLAQLNLDSPEGRVAGLRYAAPIVARLRNGSLRTEYVRLLAGWLGLPEAEVKVQVAQAARTRRAAGAAEGPSSGRVVGGSAAGGGNVAVGRAPGTARGGPGGGGSVGGGGFAGRGGSAGGGIGGGGPVGGALAAGVPAGGGPMAVGSSGRVDPIARLEYGVLMAVLQAPEVVPEAFDQLGGDAFLTPEFRAIHDAIRAAGGVAAARRECGPGQWLERVRASAASVVAGRVTELAVTPMPISDGPASAAIPGEEVDKRRDYAEGVVSRLMEAVIGRELGELRARLGRLAATGDVDESRVLLERSQLLEEERRRLREEG
ncbi:MAG: DNA primase [Bifidobacteriaceae bacterium]|nr:DNA primase [Bifidobacteriaceae bacterium]